MEIVFVGIISYRLKNYFVFLFGVKKRDGDFVFEEERIKGNVLRYNSWDYLE